MVFRRRRRYRFRRSTRRFGRRYRRRFRRRYRRRRSTKSSVVKLSYDGTWTFRRGVSDTVPPDYVAFSFTPVQLPGFADYYATYSKFRILKAYLYIGRSLANPQGTALSNALTNNYLVVGSRPFANTQFPFAVGDTLTNELIVPPQKEDALRQTRWQKVLYPGTTRTAFRVGFHPYSMISTNGPSGTTGYQYQRPWEARRWMPLTWASSTTSPIAFFGPYLVADIQSAASVSTQPAGELANGTTALCNIQLVCHVQFSGQP